MSAPSPLATPIGVTHKSFPAALWGRDPDDLDEPLASFATPLATLDRSALAANTDAMLSWARRRGLLLAPHGKTTMAPQLWRLLLDAGAWGLTLAPGWQTQVGHAHGVRRVITTTAVFDIGYARWLARAQQDGFELYSWVDSVDAVAAMDRTISGAADPVPVLVELGGDGGRTGARGRAEAGAVARAVENSRALRLAGVAGYEGSYAHDRSAAGLDRVRGYLDDLRALADALDLPADAIVSAGGSAYPDLVAETLAPLAAGGRRIVLRSGAFQVHDDGFYAGISPLRDRLRAALHVWARVISTPEEGLAVLDVGKRDLGVDEGMPVVQLVRGRGPAASDSGVIAGMLAEVTQVNDQHAYVRQPASDPLQVGEVVRLGISHPCTTLDKWRFLPLVDDARAEAPRVTGVVETWF